MLGYVLYREADAPRPPFCRVGGVRFRAVYVARGAGPRARLSAAAAARVLRREGVRTAVFPEDYVNYQSFAARGVAAPALPPLYRATAAAVALRCLAQQGVAPRQAAVALLAPSPTPELARAAEALSPQVRHLILPLPSGEALARELRFRHGVSPRLVAPGEGFCADAALCFDRFDAPAGAVPLYDPALAVRYDAAEPNGLLAALWSAGALDAGRLSVRSVRLTAPPD